MVFPKIQAGTPALVLAPMEGVTDQPMRAFLTERGGFSYCVGEFLRITQSLLPDRCFFRHFPELLSGAKTPSGTPLQVQLLGGDPERLAENASRACALGAPAIDLNFGCPAPTVNRHDGGAALLRFPHRIEQIVAAVRKAVPSHISVSAKLRLGWDNCEIIFENAARAESGGADWITIHARTKVQGYAPPVHWKYIAEVRKNAKVPIIANGDIWSLEDFKRCRDVTGCEHFMIGRGALVNPGLPLQIRAELEKDSRSPECLKSVGNTPLEWEPLLRRFAAHAEPVAMGTQFTTRRIKQWLNMARTRQDLAWFEQIKRVNNLPELWSVFSQLRQN